jgi:tetratricopeptide (TPR) repeat protein
VGRADLGHAEAIERLRALLSEDPENAELRARTAEAYRQAGNLDRAFHHFQRAAAIATRSGDAALAARMLRAADATHPNQPEILFRLAESLKILGQSAELEPVLRRLVQAATGTGDRRRLWALEELATARAPDRDVVLHLAQAHAEAGRIDEAIQVWRRSGLAPRDVGPESVSMLQQLAAFAPDRPEPGVELTATLLSFGRPREALALLVPYYERFPDHVGVLEALLLALTELGAAEKLLPARLELLKARTRVGQRSAALNDVRDLLSLAPAEPAVIEVCAHATAAFGLTAEASQLWLQLARLQEARGQRVERDRAVLLMLKASADNTEGLEFAARVLREGGKTEQAAALERRLAALLAARASPATPMSRSAPSSAARRESDHPGLADGAMPRARSEATARAERVTVDEARTRTAAARRGSGETMMVAEADVLGAAETTHPGPVPPAPHGAPVRQEEDLELSGPPIEPALGRANANATRAEPAHGRAPTVPSPSAQALEPSFGEPRLRGRERRAIRDPFFDDGATPGAARATPSLELDDTGPQPVARPSARDRDAVDPLPQPSSAGKAGERGRKKELVIQLDGFDTAEPTITRPGDSDLPQ